MTRPTTINQQSILLVKFTYYAEILLIINFVKFIFDTNIWSVAFTGNYFSSKNLNKAQTSLESLKIKKLFSITCNFR